MSNPKVLIGVVTYEGKDYIWDKFWKNLTQLSYPNFDVMIVDNSATKNYYHQLKKKKTKGFDRVTVAHVNRGQTSREAQAKSLNKIRKKALDEGYDYFLSIESDLLPPKDIIERLICHRVGVVGCIYLIGYEGSKNQPPRPCLFGVRRDRTGLVKTFNYPPKEGFGFFGNGLQQIHGCGIGTTLIRREILEKFKFWYHLEPPVKHSDVLFYMDLHNHGYPAYVDTDIIIPHYNSKWDDVPDK